jgi:hypothetical protein
MDSPVDLSHRQFLAWVDIQLFCEGVPVEFELARPLKFLYGQQEVVVQPRSKVMLQGILPDDCLEMTVPMRWRGYCGFYTSQTLCFLKMSNLLAAL